MALKCEQCVCTQEKANRARRQMVNRAVPYFGCVAILYFERNTLHASRLKYMTCELNSIHIGPCFFLLSLQCVTFTLPRIAPKWLLLLLRMGNVRVIFAEAKRLQWPLLYHLPYIHIVSIRCNYFRKHSNVKFNRLVRLKVRWKLGNL